LSNEGENLFILKAVDVCGNTASKKLILQLDNTGPEIRLAPAREFTADSLAVIQGGASDPYLQEVSLLPGGAPVAADSAVKNFTFKPRLREGANTFIITAADKMGNITQKSVTVIRDMKKPELTKPEISLMVKEPFLTLLGRYDEDNIESIRIDPGAIMAALNEKTYSYSARIKLNNGENDFTLTATDKAGNVNRMNITVNAKIDDADKAVQLLREQIAGMERIIDSLKKIIKTPLNGNGAPKP